MLGQPASLRTTCNDARRLLPASVRSKVPSAKSNAAKPILPGGLAPCGFQCNRPAINEVQHQKQIVFEGEDDALAERRNSTTVFPSASRIGGSTLRSRNGLKRRTFCSVLPARAGRGFRCRRRCRGVRAWDWSNDGCRS